MRIVDRKNPRKLYLQLVDILKKLWIARELTPGTQLPTEDQLCIRQGVSKAVVRAALLDLSQKGYLRRIAGKGTFIERPVAAHGVLADHAHHGKPARFRDRLGNGSNSENVIRSAIRSRRSLRPGSGAPGFQGDAPSPDWGSTGGIRNRVRVARSVSWFGAGGSAIQQSNRSDLRKLQHSITRCADSFEVTTLEDKEAELLQKKKGQHALLVDRIIYTTNNRVVGSPGYFLYPKTTGSHSKRCGLPARLKLRSLSRSRLIPPFRLPVYDARRLFYSNRFLITTARSSSFMHIRRITLHPDRFPATDCYPFIWRYFTNAGIELSAPVTFFAGENGTGKTTLLRAICRRCGIYIWGEIPSPSLQRNPHEGQLHRAVEVEWCNGSVPGSYFGSDNFRQFAAIVDEWTADDAGQLQYLGGNRS
jgi:DNA-binding transcriptional regulator YhcF (GntR family)